jgi:hypothetical protein
MPGKSAQIEGLSSTPLTASRAPTKTRWRPVKANHRVSGLVQRDVSRKTCGINWTVRDILDNSFFWKWLAA